ncbi:MAG: toprim domain-containing protein [Acetobacteraceae bacterium]|nr:toprim domain-containing protein [Acetobacteraceae bacterium]
MADLARALDAAAPDAALALLGEPTFRTARQWRWGRRGSLALETAGAKRGRWCDHETGEGGDMLQLARRQHHGDLCAAIDWARRFLRMPQDCARKPAGESKPVPAIGHRPAPEAASSESSVQLARSLWREAVPIAGTIAETYLREARGIRLREWPAALRFHPRCPRGAERLPALLAAMRDPKTGEGVGLHCTFLHPDGSDRLRDAMGKAMLGRAGVVMLTPSAEVTHGLFVAEGVESTLAALAIGLAPAWAAASASGIARFPVLPGIECLTILADADQAGMRAAETCAARWREAGREARIVAPERAGADFNDLAREVAA